MTPDDRVLAWRAVSKNPEKVSEYREGKTQAIGFLVGQAMKESNGQANPRSIQSALRDLLGDAKPM